MSEPQDSGLSRRDFLRASATVAGGACAAMLSSCAETQKSAAVPLPRRPLGRTGMEVSVLAFGGGSQFLANPDGQWEPMLERAVELGINLFDTSASYRWGASMTSEERFGRVLPPYRDRILLSTKVDAAERDVDACKRQVETSLNRMKTDRLDLLMIHSIEPSEDLDALARGLVPMLMNLKEQGIVRAIGFSSMNSAAKSRQMLERFDLDVCLLAMNPTKYGDFAGTALPAARLKHVGVMSMKVMRDLVGREGTTPGELLAYALTQPGVSAAVVGHVGIEKLEQNVALARQVAEGRLTVDRGALQARLARYAGPEHLCWAQPDYRDTGIC